MKAVFRFFWFIYLLLVFLPIGGALTIVCALVTICGCALGNSRFWGYYPAMCWSRLMMVLSFCPIKVEGLEKLDKNASYIFACNHCSIYDVFALYGWIGRPFKWIMKKELIKMPFIGWACSAAGHIYINRRGGKQALASIMKAENKLNEGFCIVLFPEGSRTRTGETGRFKRGAFQLASDMHLKMVPVSLSGTYQIMPPQRSYPLPHKVHILIHDPVEYVTGDHADELAQIENFRQTVISGIQ